MATHIGLADALFSSTRQRVLGILFGQPGRSFYTSELIALAARGTGGVQRELANLAASGLVTVTTVGNQKHYQANSRSPIFEELCGIVRKTIGLAQPLRDALVPLREKILAAFVYGSVAKGTDTADSDIDLMLIGDDVAYGEVFAMVDALGRVLGRPVNPTILTRQEYRDRLARREAFLTRVLEQPRIWIFGDDDILGT